MNSDIDRSPDFVDQDEFQQGRPLRLAILYPLMVALGVGGAFASQVLPVQSTIRSWSKVAMAGFFVQPTAAAVSAPAVAVPPPVIADLTKRIEGLTNEITALKQQVGQLDAAQAQSAKAAAEQQVRMSALQQRLDQEAQEAQQALARPAQPRPAQPEAAAREKRQASVITKPKPHPVLKPRTQAEATPLRIGPSSTTQQ